MSRGQAAGARVATSRDDVSYPLLLATVSLTSVMAPLNSTMIAVALPDIRGDFHVSHAAVAWLVSAYLIAMCVAQPLGGRLGDELGRSRVLRAGLATFLGFSLAAAAAPSFWALVGLRTAQAVVGAAVLPNGAAMVRETVPLRRLGEANGLTGSAIGLSAALGPVLGAALLGLGSWRLLFLANVPLVGAGMLCLAFLRYRDRPSHGGAAVDWTGALLLAGVLAALTELLGGLRGGRPAAGVATAAAAVVMGALFVGRQASGSRPLAEWRLFRIRSYSGATMYILLGNLVMYTTLLAVPFFIKEVQHKPVGTAGLLIGTLSVLMSLLSPVSGLVSDARGRRLPAMTGAACQLIAAAMLLTGIGRDVSSLYLALALAVLGLGSGLGTGAASTAAVEAAPRELAGAAAGTMSMMRYFGSILGAGVLAGVLSSDAAPGIDVFRVLFSVLVVMAAGAVVCSALVHSFIHESPRSGA